MRIRIYGIRNDHAFRSVKAIEMYIFFTLYMIAATLSAKRAESNSRERLRA